ncbi:hypothetical protein Ancab_015399 [Ancistrocladus abbreviatus]
MERPKGGGESGGEAAPLRWVQQGAGWALGEGAMVAVGRRGSRERGTGKKGQKITLELEEDNEWQQAPAAMKSSGSDGDEAAMKTDLRSPLSLSILQIKTCCVRLGRGGRKEGNTLGRIRVFFKF